MVILPRRIQCCRCVMLTTPMAVAAELRPRKVREPLDKIDPNSQNIDPWEVIVYVLALSFSLESESFVLLSGCIL